MNNENRFSGFDEDTSRFLMELTLHNYRDWFEANRSRYEQVLKTPFEALARDTAALLAERFPDDSFRLHIARIYRDARRLFGRGPYKERLWFSIHSAEGKDEGPAFYFEVGALSWEAGLGYWAPSAGAMASFRRYADAHEKELLQLFEDLKKQTFFTLGAQRYARPKGHTQDGLDTVYNAKSFWLSHAEPFDEALFDAKLPELLADRFAALLPLFRHLLLASVTG